MTAKVAEEDAVALVHKKRIQENLLRVQGMNEEITALHTEINERNQTIHEKVRRHLPPSSILSDILFSMIVSTI